MTKDKQHLLELIELLELGGDYAADAYNDFRDKGSPCAQRALANISRFDEAEQMIRTLLGDS